MNKEAPIDQVHPDAPEWFRKALEAPYEDREITVEGCPIHYLLWNRPGKPGLLLVHGGGAHAHWWRFLAPFFTDHYSVAALDLSGAGDSGRRDAYSGDLFAAELMGVCEDAGFDDKPIIVGHSFGGFVTMHTTTLYGDRLTGVVLVDSPVRPPDYQWQRDRKRAPIRPKKIYPDFDAILERFRLMPPQNCANDYLVDYIGRHSVVPEEGGWTWKFDDQLFGKFRFGDMREALKSIPCRVGVLYGDRSALFTQEIADYMFEVLDSSVPFVSIPEADHHVFLDQPLPFVAALRTLLAEWRHSRPHRSARPAS
jgi:pimeloyl-ACP methyl ester carboxylesterase